MSGVRFPLWPPLEHLQTLQGTEMSTQTYSEYDGVGQEYGQDYSLDAMHQVFMHI